VYELLETSRTPPYGYLATGASNIGLQPPFHQPALHQMVVLQPVTVAILSRYPHNGNRVLWNDNINGVISDTMLCMLRYMSYAWQSYRMCLITAKRITVSKCRYSCISH